MAVAVATTEHPLVKSNIELAKENIFGKPKEEPAAQAATQAAPPIATAGIDIPWGWVAIIGLVGAGWFILSR